MKTSETGSVDALAGQEVRLLNDLLAVLHPLARQGDLDAIDRELKALELRRKYLEDHREAEDVWRT